jgi:uncharacterized protein (TIGR02246 family)
MKTRLALALAGPLLLALPACTQAPTAPPDTRADDEKALRDQEAGALAAWVAKDADKVASFYADDATVVIPNAPAIHGREALRGGLKEVFADANFKLEFNPAGVEASKGGDLGYVKGAYTVTQTDPKTKKAVTEKGNYLMVYKKQADGSWRIINDWASSEGPAAPAAN